MYPLRIFKWDQSGCAEVHKAVQNVSLQQELTQLIHHNFPPIVHLYLFTYGNYCKKFGGFRSFMCGYKLLLNGVPVSWVTITLNNRTCDISPAVGKMSPDISKLNQSWCIDKNYKQQTFVVFIDRCMHSIMSKTNKTENVNLECSSVRTEPLDNPDTFSI